MVFIKGIAKTDMTRFWQYIFEFCKEDFSCVSVWILIGAMGSLAVMICLFFIMS